MTFTMVMVMKGAVKFIKTVFIGADASKRDEMLQTLNIWRTTGWLAAETSALVKGGPEYTKISHIAFFNNYNQ